MRLSNERRKEIIEYIMLNPDNTVNSIAKHFNIKWATANNIITKNGLTIKKDDRRTPKNKKVLTQEAIEWVKENSHLSKTEISKVLEIDYGLLLRLLERHNLVVHIDEKGEVQKRKTKYVLTEYEKHYIRQRLNTPITVLSNQLEVPVTAIRRFLDDENLDIVKGHNRLTEEQKEYIFSNRHKKSVDLSTELGVSNSTITNFANMQGIELGDKLWCPKPKNIDYHKVNTVTAMYIKKNTHKTIYNLFSELQINYWVLHEFIMKQGLDFWKGYGVLSIEQADYIKENTHRTNIELANDLDLSPPVVTNFVTINRLKKRQRELPERMKRYIEENNHLTLTQIVDNLNVQKSLVQRYIEEKNEK